jgi:D-3-phosphoglycerate dehydrogenase
VLTPHLGASTPEAQREIAIEIAHAMRDALLEGKLRNAVNVPSAGTGDMDRLRPVIELGRRLGMLAAELSDDRPDRVSVRLAGQMPSGLRLVASAVAEGLLRRSLAVPLNLVNALLLAEERGIEIVRSRIKPVSGHEAWIEVGARGGGTERTIAGSLGEDGSATLVRVDSYPVNVSPAGSLLFVWNRDVPGVIGRVGTRLGDAGVNIGEFHQSRDADSGEALAVIGLDVGLAPELLRELLAIPDVLDVRQVELGR